MADQPGWNDDFTDEDVYAAIVANDTPPSDDEDTPPTLAEMFWAAFQERALAAQMLLPGLPPFIQPTWRQALNFLKLAAPKSGNSVDCLPLTETGADTESDPEYWSGKYNQGSEEDDPDNGIYPDPLLLEQPPHAVEHYLYSTQARIPRFSWQRLLLHTWQLRTFFIDSTWNPNHGDEDLGPAFEAPWPGDNGFQRKFYREINSLAASGDEGDIARFICTFGPWNDMSHPMRLTAATPEAQRDFAPKIMRRTNHQWMTWADYIAQGGSGDEPKQPDIIDDQYGFPHGGDIFGPWILNAIRDGLNDLTTTCGPFGPFAPTNHFSNYPFTPSLFVKNRGLDPNNPTVAPFRYEISFGASSVNPFGDFSFEPPGNVNAADGILRQVDFWYNHNNEFRKASAPSADRWNLVHTDFAFNDPATLAVVRWDIGFKYTADT